MSMSRREGRILALEALFSWEVSKTPLEEILQFGWIEDKRRQKFDDTDFVFPRLLISGTLENIAAIDKKITEHLVGWEFDRVDMVDKAVIRFSTYSLMFQPDVPATVVIDEAIAIAHEYGNDESFKFVNAVLDGIRKDLEAASADGVEDSHR